MAGKFSQLCETEFPRLQSNGNITPSLVVLKNSVPKGFSGFFEDVSRDDRLRAKIATASISRASNERSEHFNIVTKPYGMRQIKKMGEENKLLGDAGVTK